jgi:hypothetical protein
MLHRQRQPVKEAVQHLHEELGMMTAHMRVMQDRLELHGLDEIDVCGTDAWRDVQHLIMRMASSVQQLEDTANMAGRLCNRVC